MRIAGSVVRPARNVRTYSQLVTSVPGFRWQLQDGQGLKLIGCSGPGIEIVPTPPLWSDQHVLGPLAIGIAVESGVSKHRAEQNSRAKLVAVVNADGDTFLTIVRRCGLGH